MSALTTLISSQGFSMTFNKITNVFTLKNSLYEFTINKTSTIGGVMGFATGTSYSSSSKSLVMPYCCNFNGIQSLNIRLDNLTTRNIDSFNASTGSVIQSIPVDPNSPTIQFIRQYEFEFSQFQSTIDYLDVSIQDSVENYVNFNNCHWSLVLCFSYITIDLERFQWKVGFENSLANGAALEQQRIQDVVYTGDDNQEDYE